MFDKSAYNIPTELRDMTEQSIKAQASYGQLMGVLTQAINAWSGASSDAMAAGFKEVQDRALAFAKENFESSLAFANELASAKDLQEVLSVQSRYAQTQIETYARQVQELGRMTGETMAGIGKKN